MKKYIAPKIEIGKVRIERGFMLSGNPTEESYSTEEIRLGDYYLIF